jgi:multidrug efflux pump subunit AcrB
MVHPIFSVLIKQPELVMDHMAGYVALVREEASSVSGEVAKRVIAWGLTVLCFIVFLVLAGVAAMLGALYGQFHWTLLAVPAISLGLAVAAFTAARKPLPQKAFTELRSQLDADAQALRSLGAGS